MNRYRLERTINVAQIKMLSLRRILIFCGIIYFIEGARDCPKSSKAHLTRCDMYYKCTVMPSGNVVWVPRNCPNGLVYDTTFRNCVIPGNEWECHAENEGRSSSAADDDENVYGVNNLSYLKEQVKGYRVDDADIDESSIEQQDDNDVDEHDYMKVDGGNSLSLTVSDENSNSNVTRNDQIESSGDGELPLDQHDSNLEIKSDYIPMPTTDKLVASQLQRLTQLIKNVNNKKDEATTDDLTPSDLNQFLDVHRLKVKQFHSNKNAVPLPQNKLIEEHHLQQILDLQKKLNSLAHHRDAYSTQAPPVKFTVSNGHYPPEASTVHINAANPLKNPHFPNVGSSTSHIVVNRPGGSVVFRLPYSNAQSSGAAAAEQKPSNEKSENHINTETLKMILELSKYMSNQSPNTPHFVHSLPIRNSYSQTTQNGQIVHPALHNFPWEQINAQSLAALMNLLQSGKLSNDGSMEKMSSVSGSVHTASEADDVAPTTIIHNHIPITVANPRPTGPIITRDQMHQMSTTLRPISNDRYDSFGDMKDRPQASAYTDSANNFYSYPNFPDKLQQVSAIVGSVATSQHQQQQQYLSQHQRPNNYNENSYEDRPNYVQIAQSKPYNPQYSDSAAFGNYRPMGTTPTFVSVHGGYTNKIYSPYTPQPHLSDENVNDFVSIDEKPYPTFIPTANYIPISSASSPKPMYADAPTPFRHRKKRPLQHGQVFDKIATFEHGNEHLENNGDDDGYDYNDGNTDNGESNNEFDHFQQHFSDPSDTDRFDNDNSGENFVNILTNYKSDQLSATAKTAPPSLPTTGGSLFIDDQHQRYDSNNNLRHKQFVSFNGNFMSLETFQQTIEPFLVKDSQANLQIDVITCSTGVRQPNQTDCTRYFVCNEKTGKILSYKCPPYTAFNGDIKLCNGDTYTKCLVNNGGDSSSILNHQKAQQLAHLIEMQRDKILNSVPQIKHKQQPLANGAKATATRPIILTSTHAPIQIHKNSETIPKPTSTTTPRTVHRKQSQPSTGTAINSASIKQKPASQSAQSSNNSSNKPKGKRKIPCKKEGKMADNQSNRHYFLCYKNQMKIMRARRLQCPAKLTFCPSSLVCTSTERCSK